MIISASGLAVGGLYAGGAFDRGEVYPLPIAEARSRLETMTLPNASRAFAGGSDAAVISAEQSADTFKWRVGLADSDPAVFSARLQPEGAARTRVFLDYRKADTGYAYADRLLSTRFMRTYAETSFHEQVDAVLEGRPADEARALQSFAAHAATHPEDMEEVGAAMEGMFKEVADQMNAMSADANIRGSTSARDRMDAATRPSTNATQPSLRLRTN